MVEDMARDTVLDAVMEMIANMEEEKKAMARRDREGQWPQCPRCCGSKGMLVRRENYGGDSVKR